MNRKLWRIQFSDWYTDVLRVYRPSRFARAQAKEGEAWEIVELR